MSSTASVDLAQVASSLGLRLDRVTKVLELLDAGNTVPFITRYRKDQTGGLDEEQIRQIQARVTQLRMLSERKQTILRSIDSQGKLTPDLAAAIAEADSNKRLEDLYLPFKPKKQTLATQARHRGLEPLALEILAGEIPADGLDKRAADFINIDKLNTSDKSNADKLVPTAAEALLGAGHILAEQFSERLDLRERLRDLFSRGAALVSSRVETEAPAEKERPADKEKAEAKEKAADTVAEQAAGETEAAPAPAAEKPEKTDNQKAREKKEKKDLQDRIARFRDYFEFRESIKSVPPHRILAINRGERDKILRVKIDGDAAEYARVADELLVSAEHPHAEFLRGCAQDALNRLVLPSLEREIRRELTDRAEAHAVEVFARNLRHLLLQPPIRGRRVLGVDPGFKSGCKLAAVDEFGTLLAHGVIHIVGKAEKRQADRAQIVNMINEHKVNVVAIGNGTACRQTEELIAELLAGELAGTGTAYVIVNEAGASVYSASPIGREEFPAFDATLRGTISIARRLQDPLSELVKIDPGSIGVGLYQHDVKAKHLRDSLEQVVESCVNYVGVDVNSASPALLRHVSGLNQLTARRIYDYRVEHGPFTSREKLLEVPGLGEAAFTQAAGFLKIVDGQNPLDATWIHPESYETAFRLLDRLGCAPTALTQRDSLAEMSQQIEGLDRGQLAGELGLGEWTLGDILTQLARPGRDPREDLPPPIFKQGVLKLEDLSVGMELTGTVLNVVDFGAFVDIGLSDSGLVHISHMSNQYVTNPHDLVAVGDIVKVWVLGVDKARRRVSLTMVSPEEPKRQPPRRGGGRPQQERPQHERSQQEQGGEAAQADTQQGSGRSQQSQGNQGRTQQRHDRRPRRQHQHQQSRPHRPPRRPVVLVDLTKEKQEGKEPLRTFGELFSLMELRKREDGEPS